MVESKFESSFLKNQKGQGTIEYVLLLVITISMILLAMTNIFKPLQSFMQDYMGTYIACLLSSGELPAIRTQNTLGSEESRCNFSIPKGNGSLSNNGSNGSGGKGSNGNNGGGSGDGSGSGEGSGSGRSSKDGKSKKGSDVASDSSTSGRGSYAGSRSNRSGFGRRSGSRGSDSNSSDGDMAGGNGKRYVNNLEGKGDRFFRSQQRVRSGRTRVGRGIATGSMTENDKEKVERTIQAQPRRVPTTSEEFSAPGKKNVLKPRLPSTEVKSLKQEDPGFAIGNLFKYILIAIILLLIIILGGGQAFEMSKTMD